MLALLESEIDVLREALELVEMLATEPQLSSLRPQHETLITVLRTNLASLRTEVTAQAAR